jgi:hypothetical protein
MINILKFIKENENWEQLLADSPYSIKTKWDGDYFILKYNQFASDFTNPIVRECRGSIFYRNPETAEITCVCMPFYKFGNYNENYADAIDWETAKVQEKVDGSLIKMWYHNETWHISTNGTIDAYKANTFAEGITYGNLVDMALGENKEKFFDSLTIGYAYMFELVSPYNQMTIFYPETSLYLIGARFMPLGLEMETSSFIDSLAPLGIKFPKVYWLENLEECLEAVKVLSKDEEGFVVVDKNFRRVKIKSEEYMKNFHLVNNNSITTKRVMEFLREEKLDDLISYCPQFLLQINEALNLFNKLEENIVVSAFNAPWGLPKKEFAAFVETDPHKDYLLFKYDKPDVTVREWLMNIRMPKLLREMEKIKNG